MSYDDWKYFPAGHVPESGGKHATQSAYVERLEADVARLTKELAVAEAFHAVAVKERDYERVRVARWQEQASRAAYDADERDALLAQCAADTALLKRMEWQGHDPYDEPTVGYCPVCQHEKPDGHSDWCDLAARLSPPSSVARASGC